MKNRFEVKKWLIDSYRKKHYLQWPKKTRTKRQKRLCARNGHPKSRVVTLYNFSSTLSKTYCFRCKVFL